jgi:amidase
MGDELATLDATAQAELVRSGDVTTPELVDAAIARVERLNPELNAVIHPLYEKAREIATAPLSQGPFAGVPFLVKDAVCHTAGDPYHVGMRFLKDRQFIADSDTELARRFRAAGFVFVGKTNTPELAASATTEPLSYGATVNPWNPEHSTAGSSGGSAAAVAAGLVPAAHANDMGGSIRLPAAHCGLVGLKPTRARGSLAPGFGEFWGPLTHEHVVTRTVRDCAGILDAVAGPAPGDPYSAPPPLGPWRDEVGRDPGSLRIGLLEPPETYRIHTDCLAAADSTAKLLEDLGHRVEAISIPSLDRVELGPWLTVGIARDLERWSEIVGEEIGPDDVEPMTWTLAEAGRGKTGVQYVAEEESAWKWAREICIHWRRDFDILLSPTAATPPAKLGYLAPDVPMNDLFARLAALTCFTMPFDVTGQPAISLPLFWNDAGLPIGVQLVAETGREDQLFRLSAQLEQAQPWASKRPGLHA